MSVPVTGESYRGVQGHSGYLLRQAWHAFRSAMDTVVRPNGLSYSQYGVLSVLARDPGASGADLARAFSTTPQTMNGVLATLERESLIERHPHPTHGRILQVTLTAEGIRRLEAATPAVRGLERAIERDFTALEVETVKRWLVAAASASGKSTLLDQRQSQGRPGNERGTGEAMGEGAPIRERTPGAQ